MKDIALEMVPPLLLENPEQFNSDPPDDMKMKD